MAKGKRPFSTFLDNPNAKKAVQDALNAPAQLPSQDQSAGIATAESSIPETAGHENPQIKPGAKKKSADQKEDYQLVLVRKSVHRLLKLASVHYNLEIREIASDAIAADLRVQQMRDMQERFGEK